MKEILARCPQCKKSTSVSSENPWRPFCSERCRIIDLGAWASESYRVPIQDAPPEADSIEDSESNAAPDAELNFAKKI